MSNLSKWLANPYDPRPEIELNRRAFNLAKASRCRECGSKPGRSCKSAEDRSVHGVRFARGFIRAMKERT